MRTILKLILLAAFIIGSFLVPEKNKLTFYVFYIALIVSNIWINQDNDE